MLLWLLPVAFASRLPVFVQLGGDDSVFLNQPFGEDDVSVTLAEDLLTDFSGTIFQNTGATEEISPPVRLQIHLGKLQVRLSLLLSAKRLLQLLEDSEDVAIPVETKHFVLTSLLGGHFVTKTQVQERLNELLLRHNIPAEIIMSILVSEQTDIESEIRQIEETTAKVYFF